MDHVLESISPPKNYIVVTHSKISVFRVANEFHFDTYINYVTYVARCRCNVNKSKFVGSFKMLWDAKDWAL